MPMIKIQSGADCDPAAPNRGRNSESKGDPASLQGNADHRTDVLPLEGGIRLSEIGSSDTIEAA